MQELDVSGILATQIFTWVDDDVEMETKGYPFTLFLNGDIAVWMMISTDLYLSSYFFKGIFLDFKQNGSWYANE